MSKHTAGPWVIDWEVNENGPMIFPEDGHAICLIEDGYDPKTEKRLSRVEANTALIAAAPEMLEALKTVVEYARRNGYAGNDIGRAMNVIAKAEGGKVSS